jgi:7,8-dihydropterin-6-yl-methyl-4-(beta-D-ribofuranosyl)aminobenzene 5'-phosphate synthase
MGEDGLFPDKLSKHNERWIKRRGAEPVSWGALDRAALDAASVGAVCCETPQALRGAFTTGHIPRQSFEQVLENTLVESEGDASPSPDHFTDAEWLGRLVPDQHPDEHATCYIVEGRGLVVISSCGHVGLINTIKLPWRCPGSANCTRCSAGFISARRRGNYVDHTVVELDRLSPDVVIPMHCRGAKFIAAMHRQMPNRLVTANIGSRFTFGV